jgi:hypothetical protein
LQHNGRLPLCMQTRRCVYSGAWRQNVRFATDLITKSEQDMTRLEANSCENAYYAMSGPLMVKCDVINLNMTLQRGCQRVRK